jgi:hypothetical protein
LSPNQILHRKCTDCTATHQNIYYRRFDICGLPAEFDLFDLVKNNWFSDPKISGNTFNQDFKLYSTYSDALEDKGAWPFCNFDDTGIGFPRDCGPNRLVGGQWNSFEAGRGGKSNIGFYVETSCYYSCEAARQSGMTESGKYDMCPTGDPNESFTAFCDQDTDGGGWMLFFAYNHKGGENGALDQSVLPTDPKAGYSHMDLKDTGYDLADIEAVRFYCDTSAHNKKMHFTTRNSKVKEIAYTGSQVGNTVASWTTDFTPLASHSANLPAATTNSPTGNSRGLHNFPFFSANKYYWAARGGGNGNRWECDARLANRSQDTLHNIWVRMETRNLA